MAEEKRMSFGYELLWGVLMQHVPHGQAGGEIKELL